MDGRTLIAALLGGVDLKIMTFRMWTVACATENVVHMINTDTGVLLTQ